MVDFVLDHQAQPFPERDRGAIRRDGFLREIFIAEAGENLHGFGVEAIHVGEDFIVAIGELAGMAGVGTGAELGVFGPHEALGGGQVAKDIAESVAAFAEGPFELIARDATRDAQCAGADFIELLGEIGGVGNGHLQSLCRDKRLDALAGGCGIYGLGEMEDEEAAAVGAEGEEDGEDDESR